MPPPSFVRRVVEKAHADWSKSPSTTSIAVGIDSHVVHQLDQSQKSVLRKFSVLKELKVNVHPDPVQFFVLRSGEMTVVDASNDFRLHLSMGHVGGNTILEMHRRGYELPYRPGSTLRVRASEMAMECSSCQEAKAVRPSAPDRPRDESLGALQHIVMDTKGPMSKGVSDARHAFLMVCRKTNFMFGAVLTNLKKGTVAEAVRRGLESLNRLAAAEGVPLQKNGGVGQYPGAVRVLQSDNAKSFTASEVREVCKTLGVAWRRSSPYLHQNNATVETQWRPLFNMVRAMLHAADLPAELWPHAFLHCVWLRNRIPQLGYLDGVAPLEAVSGKRPSLKAVRPFGSEIHVYLDASKRVETPVSGKEERKARQLADRAKTGLYIGHDEISTAFKYIDPHQPSKVLLSGMARISEESLVKRTMAKKTPWLGTLEAHCELAPPEDLRTAQPKHTEFEITDARAFKQKEDNEYYAILEIAMYDEDEVAETKSWILASDLMYQTAENSVLISRPSARFHR